MKKIAEINYVAPHSLAQKAGLCAGDAIFSINGEEVTDILDYRFLAADEKLEIKVCKKDGTNITVEIKNPNYNDLGIEFACDLIDETKSCKNACVFCFIDQLPKGMRKTMYFKDDDVRLSFLLGNYVTMTNLSDEDIDRLIKRRISPINVSVHTTNMELRKTMLRNKNADKLMERMKKLAMSGIEMNCQIVLCPGINDGKELEKSLNDLLDLSTVHSVSVVPVGITKHREGLHPLESYEKDSATEVLKIVNEVQKKALLKCGTRFVYASDEFYILAEQEIPNYEEYEDFPQIENGVGMIANFEIEMKEALEDLKENQTDKTVSIITGMIAKDFMQKCASEISVKFPKLKLQVLPIKNEFFGEKVTVAGLVCGNDIIKQLKGKDLGSEAFIPMSMLKHGTDLFLDDVTISDLEKELETKITPIECDGYSFIDALLRGAV